MGSAAVSRKSSSTTTSTGPARRAWSVALESTSVAYTVCSADGTQRYSVRRPTGISATVTVCQVPSEGTSARAAASKRWSKEPADSRGRTACPGSLSEATASARRRHSAATGSKAESGNSRPLRPACSSGPHRTRAA
ncbi:hypothetical protein WKI68_38270 [Streptomyces sp. MS1.HAVA.3]|uniref:DUF1508 domain-containing protein n=1 Tax=Streptomyces caledonius TaxID=3134107 RepID=A0ABU8UC79_9ACTN